MKTNRYFVWIALAGLCLLSSCHSREEMSYSTDPVTNIEGLWQIIDTRYCYIEDKGIDWDAIREEYVAKAARLNPNDQVALFDLCAGMLDSLRDGHVNLYSAFDRSVNTAWFDTFPANYDARLQAPYLKDCRAAGGLYYNTIDSGRVGYIYYSSFSNSFSAGNIYWIFKAFEHCEGLIIDVRNNGGGDITNAYRLSSPFFTANETFGYWRHKTGPGHGDFSDYEPLTTDAEMVGSKWGRPVVVLCNRRSYSAANLFVNMMRYAPHAQIVGGTSGGGGGMPLSYEMPNGWMVRLSSVRMYDRDKKDIENGIEPDVKITMTGSGQDDIIEQAILIIRLQKMEKN